MNYYYYQDAEVRTQIDELLQQNAHKSNPT